MRQGRSSCCCICTRYPILKYGMSTRVHHLSLSHINSILISILLMCLRWYRWSYIGGPGSELALIREKTCILNQLCFIHIRIYPYRFESNLHSDDIR